MPNYLGVGPLRQRITIQQNSPARDEYGQSQPDWSDVGERWARIEPAVGGPWIQSDQLRNSSTHRITMRYFAGLTPRHRILYGDRVFNITGTIVEDERKIKTVVACQEVI